MKTTLLGWLTLLAAFTLLAVPASARADKNRLDKKVDRLINTLLTARDDDDREDAAKLLGKIGGPSALVALEYAAKSDEDRGVRKDARKAAEKIRARLFAEELTNNPPRTIVLHRSPVICRPPTVYYSPVVVARHKPWSGYNRHDRPMLRYHQARHHRQPARRFRTSIGFRFSF